MQLCIIVAWWVSSKLKCFKKYQTVQGWRFRSCCRNATQLNMHFSGHFLLQQYTVFQQSFQTRCIENLISTEPCNGYLHSYFPTCEATVAEIFLPKLNDSFGITSYFSAYHTSPLLINKFLQGEIIQWKATACSCFCCFFSEGYGNKR